MTVGILYICIGEYVKFWERFYKSAEINFLPLDKKEYFLFTDKPLAAIAGAVENDNIHVFFQSNLGWPGNTLFRYRMFEDHIEEIKHCEYLFFFNSNIVFEKEIAREEYLPVTEDLVVTQHPGYFCAKPYDLPFCRKRKSRAFVPYSCVNDYVCGGLNGGKTPAYLRMIVDLNERIKKDFEEGIVATWHDESHLNRYIIDKGSYKLLSPAYSYPEGWSLPFEKKITILEKSKYIRLDKRKTRKQFRIFAGVIRRIRFFVFSFAEKWLLWGSRG